MTYHLRPIKFIVAPAGVPIFSERATTVELDDEGGGEFLVVRQNTEEHGEQRIAFDAEEWPHIRRAINRAVRARQEDGE
ncbi:MAG: hypothetical protein PWP11_892 [Thauera sp.]|nr:hypothetical protein [Thauera sp.]MDI3489615.1 hypothetical protein [Thauera sp.]